MNIFSGYQWYRVSGAIACAAVLVKPHIGAIEVPGVDGGGGVQRGARGGAELGGGKKRRVVRVAERDAVELGKQIHPLHMQIFAVARPAATFGPNVGFLYTFSDNFPRLILSN